MARGIDFDPIRIKSWLFDEMADMDETLGIDGVPLRELQERIENLRPIFTYLDIRDLMTYDNMGLIDALEKLEDELASM